MDNKATAEQRIADAMTIVNRYAGIEGEHHKTWVIDQIVRMLLGDDYNDWVAKRNSESGGDGDTYQPWNTGISP